MTELDKVRDQAQKAAKKKLGIGFWITIIALLILDQGSKFYIIRYIPLHNSIPIIESFLDITHIRNSGIAFGLFSGEPTKFKAFIMGFITFLSLILIVYFFSKIKSSSHIFYFGLSFILAGALGNMIDRLFRGGEVIDFIDVHWYELYWPSFNVADSAITIGVGFLILDSFLNKEPVPPTVKSNEHE